MGVGILVGWQKWRYFHPLLNTLQLRLRTYCHNLAISSRLRCYEESWVADLEHIYRKRSWMSISSCCSLYLCNVLFQTLSFFILPRGTIFGRRMESAQLPPKQGFYHSGQQRSRQGRIRLIRLSQCFCSTMAIVWSCGWAWWRVTVGRVCRGVTQGGNWSLFQTC